MNRENLEQNFKQNLMLKIYKICNQVIVDHWLKVMEKELIFLNVIQQLHKQQEQNQ